MASPAARSPRAVARRIEAASQTAKGDGNLELPNDPDGDIGVPRGLPQVAVQQAEKGTHSVRSRNGDRRSAAFRGLERYLERVRDRCGLVCEDERREGSLMGDPCQRILDHRLVAGDRLLGQFQPTLRRVQAKGAEGGGLGEQRPPGDRVVRDLLAWAR